MTESLRAAARHADSLLTQGRMELVNAARQAARGAMPQKQIAAAIGRSQPEVSRLLHFQGRTPLAMRLRKCAPEVKRRVAEAGGSNVRVFGSVSTGTDNEDSDIDLLFTMGPPLSLMQLGALERAVGEILGAPVDLVPDSALKAEVEARISAEAVPL